MANPPGLISSRLMLWSDVSTVHLMLTYTLTYVLDAFVHDFPMQRLETKLGTPQPMRTYVLDAVYA